MTDSKKGAARPPNSLLRTLAGHLLRPLWSWAHRPPRGRPDLRLVTHLTDEGCDCLRCATRRRAAQ